MKAPHHGMSWKTPRAASTPNCRGLCTLVGATAGGYWSLVRGVVEQLNRTATAASSGAAFRALTVASGNALCMRFSMAVAFWAGMTAPHCACERFHMRMQNA